MKYNDKLSGSMAMLTQTASSFWWGLRVTDETTGEGSWEEIEFVSDFPVLWNSAQACVLEAYYVASCADFPTQSTVFQYPTVGVASFGAISGDGVTAMAPNSDNWGQMPASARGYTGSSCGFITDISGTALGTTLQY